MSTTTNSDYRLCECCPQEKDPCLQEILEILGGETVSDGQKLLDAFKQTFYLPKEKKYRLTTRPNAAGTTASASEPAKPQRPARQVLSKLLEGLPKSTNWGSVLPEVREAVTKVHEKLQQAAAG